ncbi:septum formation initiator family protein [Puniceicoccaceae bacterium K14]|nr:septum formation initiator family protein [Puniceicoccaceae bacterium K14]
MNIGRIVHYLSVLAFAGIAVYSAASLYENYQELREMEDQEAIAEMKLNELKAESKRRQIVLQKLEDDPEYIERSIRTKLGYAEKDEVVFRFE